LAVVDSFEQAIASIGSADEDNSSEILEKMREGVHLTYDQLKKVLEKNSIKDFIMMNHYVDLWMGMIMLNLSRILILPTKMIWHVL